MGAGARPSCHTKIASRTPPPAKVANVMASNNPVSGKAIKPKATPAKPAKASSAPGQSMPPGASGSTLSARRRQAIQRAARQSNGLMKKIACQGR